jgi:hypothetical protein
MFFGMVADALFFRLIITILDELRARCQHGEQPGLWQRWCEPRGEYLLSNEMSITRRSHLTVASALYDAPNGRTHTEFPQMIICR